MYWVFFNNIGIKGVLILKVIIAITISLRCSDMKFLSLPSIILFFVPSFACGAVDMFGMAGTPEEMGTIWGELNAGIVVSDMNSMYLQPAYAAGISNQTLIDRSALFVQIAAQKAPHWLEEGRAIARAAGVNEDLYLAFIDGHVRNRFLYADPAAAAASSSCDEIIECTSYTVSRSHAKDGAIFFHKTRDNVDRPQMTPMLMTAQEGINKFLTVTDGGVITCSMIVNDKGLCGSCDYPADKKPESTNLVPPAAPIQNRGAMGGAILRHIAERASTSMEALGIIQEFVANGWYGGGSVGGNHWLFVDRNGVALEVSNNSGHVIYQVHNEDVFTTNYVNRPAFEALRNADEVDFEMFRNASRQSPIYNAQSIAGMTVEVDPDYPELLTCAWFSLPARHVAYPVFMGQNAVPMPLADGSAYASGKSTTYQPELWKAMERTMHAEKELLRQVVVDNINAGTPIPQLDKLLEDWSRTQATAIIGQSTGFVRNYYSTEPAGIRIANSAYTINTQEMDAAFAGFFYSTPGQSNTSTLVKAGPKTFTLIGDHDYSRRSEDDVPFSLRVEGGLYKVIGALNIESGDFSLSGGRVEARSVASAGQTWNVALTPDYAVAGQDILVHTSGTADITNASLNISLANGYTPTSETHFTLLKADAIQGAAAGGQLFGYADGEEWLVDNARFRIEFLDEGSSDSIRLTARSAITLGLVDNGCPAAGFRSYTLTATGPGITTLAKFIIDGELHQVFHGGEPSEWLNDGSALYSDACDSHVIFGNLRIPDLNGAGTEKVTKETITGGGESGMGTLNNFDEASNSYDAYMRLNPNVDDPDETVELMQLVVENGKGFSIDLDLLSTHNHDENSGGMTVKTNKLSLSLTSARGPGDANRDGFIDENDASILAQHWQQTGDWDAGDFNGDGVVNDIDAALLAANWTGSPSASVPEPGRFLLCFPMLLAAVVIHAANHRESFTIYYKYFNRYFN